MSRTPLLAVLASALCSIWLFPTAAAAVDCGPEGGVSPNVSYVQQETGNHFRDVVIGLVGHIPEAGSALQEVTGFLWKAPDSEASAVFDQMKAYVDELVPELIAQERVRELEQRLAGLHHVLRDYNRTSYGTPQKGEWFTNLLALLDQAEPFFFDERNPEKTLTYFVPLGTLRLLALQEQYLYYSRIYDRADPDRGKHLEDLRTAIATYSAALTQAKAAAVNWRVQMKTGIDTRTQQTVGVLGPTTTTTWTAIDRLCSWQVSYQHNSLSGGDLYGEEHAKRDLEQRRQQVTFAYTANLELLLAPAELWQYMDPTNQNRPSRKPISVYVTSGPFGSSANEQPFDDNSQGQPITRVVVYAGQRVDGLEVFYGGRSGGLHGQRGGNTYALDMQPGEAIVSAHGRAGDAMDVLYFKTNMGREVGGGGVGGNPWTTAPPQGSNATLFKVSGRQGSNHLAGLTFTWRYFRQEAPSLNATVCGRASLDALTVNETADVIYARCFYSSGGNQRTNWLEAVDIRGGGASTRVQNLTDSHENYFASVGGLAFNEATQTLYLPFEYIPMSDPKVLAITALQMKGAAVAGRYQIDLPASWRMPTAANVNPQTNHILLGISTGRGQFGEMNGLLRIDAAARKVISGQYGAGPNWVRFIATDGGTGVFHFGLSGYAPKIPNQVFRCDSQGGDERCGFMTGPLADGKWPDFVAAASDSTTGDFVVLSRPATLYVATRYSNMTVRQISVPNFNPNNVIADGGKVYLTEGSGGAAEVRAFDLNTGVRIGTWKLDKSGGAMLINHVTKTLFVARESHALAEISLADPPPFP